MPTQERPWRRRRTARCGPPPRPRSRRRATHAPTVRTAVTRTPAASACRMAHAGGARAPRATSARRGAVACTVATRARGRQRRRQARLTCRPRHRRRLPRTRGRMARLWHRPTDLRRRLLPVLLPSPPQWLACAPSMRPAGTEKCTRRRPGIASRPAPSRTAPRSTRQPAGSSARPHRRASRPCGRAVPGSALQTTSASACTQRPRALCTRPPLRHRPGEIHVARVDTARRQASPHSAWWPPAAAGRCYPTNTVVPSTKVASGYTTFTCNNGAPSPSIHRPL